LAQEATQVESIPPSAKGVYQHIEINILNDVIPYKRGYSTGVLSHREGGKGKKK